MEDILANMNIPQREAILTLDGPLLVLAGAGAGKTRVIAHRIREIALRDKRSDHILAITFTNKAASEMRERITTLLTDTGVIRTPYTDTRHLPFISTFHSLGLTIIKEQRALLGLKRTPSIYDRSDSLRTIKEALKGLGGDDMEPRALFASISRYKSDGVVPEKLIDAEHPYERMIGSVWQRYDAALRKDHAFDFDDLLVIPVSLLRQHPDVRAHYQKRWQYIHVDEYQDTNYIQAQLTGLLVGEQRHLCVVGDIDQTIYSWRGAQIANLMQFEKTYPGAKTVMLEQNYRSTKNILEAANDIITKNIYRPDKQLYTDNVQGEALSLYQAYDESDEGNFIVRMLQALMAEGGQPRDCAVLYRANFQSRAIEEQLLAHDVPYQVLGTRFFERKEVKDVLSYLRAALSGGDADIARVANTPVRGIGKVTLMKLLMHKEDELRGAVREKVSQFHSLLGHIAQAASSMPPSQAVQFVIVQSGIDALLRKDKIEGTERLENLRELVSLAARYDKEPLGEGVLSFLESAALASDQDELKEETNSVRLMTVHASKGLEFPYVFIVGLEDGLFPYARDNDEDSDKEEERRLMYVALTRAKKKVFLSYASYRTIFGSKNATSPSPFLSDISPDLISWESPEFRTIYLE